MRVIIGEQHIGPNATEEDRDEFAWNLVSALERNFPNLDADYNPLSGVPYEWQDGDASNQQEIEDWVAHNWEDILEATFN